MIGNQDSDDNEMKTLLFATEYISTGLGYHESSCSSDTAPDIEYKICMTMEHISIERMLDDAW